VDKSQLESARQVIERTITYARDITDYRNAMVKNLSLNESLARSGLIGSAEGNTDIKDTIKIIDEQLRLVIRPVNNSSGLSSEEAQAQLLQAIAAAREGAKNDDADVKALFEGIETYLCRAHDEAYPRAPSQVSSTDVHMKKLHETVSKVQSALESRTDMKPERKAKLTAEVESLVINIQATQNSRPFANGSTFNEAKNSTINQLNKLEKTTEFKKFITEVKNKISKIGKIILPKMAQHLLKEHDNKIAELKKTTEVIRSAKGNVQYVREEPRSPGKR
jgi:hypothetical protein